MFEVANRISEHAQLERLYRKNGAFAERRRSVAAHLDKFRGYSLTKYYPQKQFPEALTDRDIRIVAELQLESGVDVVSIPEPYPECSPLAFESSFSKTWKYIEECRPEVGVMPYLSMAQDPTKFEGKMEVLSQHEHSLWAVGVSFASPLEYRPNYFTLADFGEKDFWIHCSNGRKFPNWQAPVAQLQALARYGIDTISTAIPNAPIQRPGDKKKPKANARNVRYLLTGKALYSSLEDVATDDDPLPCNEPCCKGLDVEAFIASVEGVGPTDEIQLRVNDRAKIHDVFASTVDFQAAQRAIKEGHFRTHLAKKEGIRKFGGSFLDRRL